MNNKMQPSAKVRPEKPAATNAIKSSHIVLNRKLFLRLIIGSLVVSAALGIYAIITSSIDPISVKILGTTVAFDIASIFGLCYVGRTTSSLHRVFQITGLIAASIALIAEIILIWNFDLFNGPYWIGLVARFMGTATVTAIAATHGSLLLPAAKHSKNLKLVTYATIAVMVVVAELVINFFLIKGFNPSHGYVKTIGVLFILDALGSISIPLVRRFSVPQIQTPE